MPNSDDSKIPTHPPIWDDSPAASELEDLQRESPPPASPPIQTEPVYRIEPTYLSPFPRVGCTGGGSCCVFPCFGCVFLLIFLLTSSFGLIRYVTSDGLPQTRPLPMEQRSGEGRPG